MFAAPHSLPAQATTAGFGLAAVLSWGVSDFLGGFATRRANAFLFTAIVNIGGLILMGSLAAATAPFPASRGALWGLAAGLAGGASLAVFYRALSTGKMGLVAPVSAVLGAAIPALFSAFTEGLPGRVPMLGFVSAAVGLWLITRSEDGSSPEGIGLAVIAGVGFAGFYLCARQAGNIPALWIAALSRMGGLVATGSIVLLQRKFHEIDRAAAGLAVFTGCVDSLGTIFFVRASQTGRLDEAVVISSLYPAVTVLLARLILHERFTRWKLAGLLAALAAVPMIAGG
jgi:uncharacterized membrane protein